MLGPENLFFFNMIQSKEIYQSNYKNVFVILGSIPSQEPGPPGLLCRMSSTCHVICPLQPHHVRTSQHQLSTGSQRRFWFLSLHPLKNSYLTLMFWSLYCCQFSTIINWTRFLSKCKCNVLFQYLRSLCFWRKSSFVDHQQIFSGDIRMETTTNSLNNL